MIHALDPMIELVQQHIKQLQDELRRLQDNCLHPYATKRHFARSPFEYCVTHHIEYHCPHCDKRWIVDAGP